MALAPQISQKINRAPQKPGIYLFRDKAGSVLYVGKAINLRSRLSFYLRPVLGTKTYLFLHKARRVDWITVTSDLEAILLEMNLIKQLKPPYNSVWRDDKRPLYLVITQEEYPKIKTARRPHTDHDTFGPFPSPLKLRQVLRALRGIFPFCTCKHPKNACLNTDLGLCRPSPPTVTSQSQKEQYLANIRRLKLFLSGKTKQVTRELTAQMHKASRTQDFETAASVRDQLATIQTLLTRPPSVAAYLQNDVLAPNLPNLQVQAVARLLHINSVQRIEGYDVANLGGRLATASLVVFENGRPNPDQYRRFKVRLPESPNDPAMMRHVLARRLNHSEWELPQVILIDGGKAQVGAVQKLIAKESAAIRIVGLAKREETLVIPALTGNRKWDLVELPPEDPALTLLKAVRNEAHRFATTYHKLLRLKKANLSGGTLTRMKHTS